MAIRLPAQMALLGWSVALLTLAGCASSPTDNYGPDAACGSERLQLMSYRQFFAADMAGATVGQAAGTTWTDLKGLFSGDTAAFHGYFQSIGSSVGGYFHALKQATSNQGGVVKSIYQDVAQENQKIDGVTAAFAKLRDCRLNSAAEVRRDFKARRLGADDAKARLDDIRQLFEADIAYAESLGARINDRGSEYIYATNEVVKDDPNARKTLAKRDAAGGGWMASEAVRVHAEPALAGKQIGSLAPREAVTTEDGGAPAGEWTAIKLKDGRTGYVATRLLVPRGSKIATAATTTPTPAGQPDAADVAQLTETNQLKRKALSDSVANAKTVANSGAFDLSGKISRGGAGAGAA